MSEREREKHTKRGFYEVIRRTPLKKPELKPQSKNGYYINNYQHGNIVI